MWSVSGDEEEGVGWPVAIKLFLETKQNKADCGH